LALRYSFEKQYLEPEEPKATNSSIGRLQAVTEAQSPIHVIMFTFLQNKVCVALAKSFDVTIHRR
jgi:predicted amidohydrolase